MLNANGQIAVKADGYFHAGVIETRLKGCKSLGRPVGECSVIGSLRCNARQFASLSSDVREIFRFIVSNQICLADEFATIVYDASLVVTITLTEETIHTDNVLTGTQTCQLLSVAEAVGIPDFIAVVAVAVEIFSLRILARRNVCATIAAITYFGPHIQPPDTAQATVVDEVVDLNRIHFGGSVSQSLALCHAHQLPLVVGFTEAGAIFGNIVPIRIIIIVIESIGIVTE